MTIEQFIKKNQTSFDNLKAHDKEKYKDFQYHPSKFFKDNLASVCLRSNFSIMKVKESDASLIFNDMDSFLSTMRDINKTEFLGYRIVRLDVFDLTAPQDGPFDLKDKE